MNDLDYAAGEFVNHLYQEGDPYGYAGDFVAGLRRFFPQCRRHVVTTRLFFFNNWKRGLCLRQALPIPVDLLQGMAGAAIALGKHNVAAALLIGFCGLLRTSEMVNLRKRQVQLLRHGTRMVINLTGITGAKRNHIVEHIIIHDEGIVICAAIILKYLDEGDFLLRWQLRGACNIICQVGELCGHP